MAQRSNSMQRQTRRIVQWLLRDDQSEKEGPYHRQEAPARYPWWQVMCLTGVDYFSTLGYQPGIAALAAGALAPLATLILVLLTLGGALPVYRWVAEKSSHGEGSIAMLEHLLPWWQGKLFVLCLLGFVATDFIITITLSAADAAAHMTENPIFSGFFHGHNIGITLVLLLLLCIIFLNGFQEAVRLAVLLVGVYLLLNLVTIGVSLQQVVQHPEVFANWKATLLTSYPNPIMLLGVPLLLFPKLALGLSGFETGVVVMPLVKGSRTDSEEHPQGRIKNTHKLLATAAGIMSLLLMTSSVVTILLIPAQEFQAGGKANGRALAYLAHQYLGNGFGTIYDLSTIAILWFAGASAMAGLLNIVPRYLPRYGMAPTWTRAARPLVLIYTLIAFSVTLFFKASVDAQGSAYATGVLALISSAAFAVTLSAHRRHLKRSRLLFGAITLIFIYTTIVNIFERPEGLKIAAFFILTIIMTSLASRVWRSTELRTEQVEMDALASAFIHDVAKGPLRVIANRCHQGDQQAYDWKEQAAREDNHMLPTEAVLFLEIQVADASEFIDITHVQGVRLGRHRILRAQSAAVPNAIAAILLYIRDQTGTVPHAYFSWTEGNPVQHLVQFLLLGEGDVPVLTHEVLRKAERDPDRRPVVHVGG